MDSENSLAPKAPKYASSGFVFIIKDGNIYTIGCADDPNIRLQEFKNMGGHSGAQLLGKYRVKDKMREAEIKAVDAVKGEHDIVSIRKTRFTWYKYNNEEDRTERPPDYRFTSTVERAVKKHNKELQWGARKAELLWVQVHTLQKSFGSDWLLNQNQ